MLANKIHRGDYFISKEVSSLIDISVEVVSANFSLYPSLPGLKSAKLAERIIDKVAVTLPLQVTAPNISLESY